jgi:hypothetical protein
MPTLSFTVTYDGSDSEISKALGRMVSAFGSPDGSPAASIMSQSANGSPGWADNVAPKFAGFVFQTAARGEKSQKHVVEAWLRHDGAISATALVKASGVKRTHDYSGVGSSLTRNMKKSGGPKKWYDTSRDIKGEKIYRMSPELVEPLKRAFKV